MAKQQELSFAIRAVNEASKVLKEVTGDVDASGKSAETANGKFGGLGSTLGKLAIAAGGAFAAFEVKSYITDSIDAFSSLAGAVKKAQLVMGGSVEDASRLLFVFEEKGVAPDKATAAIGKFEKAVAGVVDAEDGGLLPAGKAQVAMWKELGVELEDSSGKIRPTNDLMMDMADVFKKLGPGTESTALALKTFGKAGADILPVMLLGKEGVKDFEDESDKLGHTLSGSQLDAYKKNAAAQKEFSAAMEGVKIQLGAALMPVLAKSADLGATLAVKFNQEVIPAIKKLSDEAGPKVKEFFDNVSTWWDKQGKPMIDNLLAAWNGLSPVIIPMLKTLGDDIQTAMNIISGILKVVSDLLSGDWSKAWKDAKELVNTVMEAMKTKISDTIGVISGMAGLAKDAGAAIGGGIKSGLSDAMDGLADLVKGIFNDGVIGPINGLIRAIDGINIHIPGFDSHIPGVPSWGGSDIGFNIGTIPTLAAGGIAMRPTLAMVGDGGEPEAIVPLSRLGGGGLGGGHTFVINALDGESVRRIIPTIVRELEQHDRRAYGIAV